MRNLKELVPEILQYGPVSTPRIIFVLMWPTIGSNPAIALGYHSKRNFSQIWLLLADLMTSPWIVRR